MKEAKKSRLMEIFDDEPDKPEEVTATFATMKRIYKEYGKLHKNFLAEDGVTLDYDRIAKIYWFIVQQDDPSVTEEDILGKLTQANAHKAIPLLAGALSLFIPEELRSMVTSIEDDEPDKPADTPPAKDDKGGGKAKNLTKAKSST